MLIIWYKIYSKYVLRTLIVLAAVFISILTEFANVDYCRLQIFMRFSMHFLPLHAAMACNSKEYNWACRRANLHTQQG